MIMLVSISMKEKKRGNSLFSKRKIKNRFGRKRLKKMGFIFVNLLREKKGRKGNPKHQDVEWLTTSPFLLPVKGLPCWSHRWGGSPLKAQIPEGR